MGALLDAARRVYRLFSSDGLPATPQNEPDKLEIISLFAQIDAFMQSVGASSAITVSKLTKAALDADLAFAAGTLAVVTNDGANTGVYRKNGASGTGSWTLVVSLDLGDKLAAGVLPSGRDTGQKISEALDGEIADREALIAEDGAATLSLTGPRRFVGLELGAGRIDLGGGSAIESSPDFEVRGPLGFISILVDETGVHLPPDDPAGVTTRATALDADIAVVSVDETTVLRLWPQSVIYGVQSIGQSYDVFINGAASPSPYNLTAVLAGRLLMAAGAGVVPDNVAWSSFADLVEGGRSGAPLGESYFSEMGKVVFAALDAAHGAAAATRQMACIAAGRPGSPYPYMVPGGEIMAEYEANIRNAMAAAAAAGKTYEVGCVITWQGQADIAQNVTLEARVQRILMLQRDVEARAQALTGQARLVKLVILGPDRGTALNSGKPCWGSVAVAEAARRAPDRIIMASAGYEHETGGSGGGHPLTAGYRTAGVAIGRAIVEGVLGAGYPVFAARGWKKISATVIRIFFDMVEGRSLVIDDGSGPVPLTGMDNGKGWVIRWGDLTAGNKLISSVAVADTGLPGGTAQALDITTGGPIDFDTFELTYANNNQSTGRARGLIRDDGPAVTLPGVSYPVGRRWLAPAYISSR